MKNLFLLLLLLLSGNPTHAAPRSQATSQHQVDGIVSAVVDGLWKQTDVYWHRGDYPRIIALDRIIVGGDPHFVESYSTGGWLMESLGNKSDAEAFYQMAVKNNPTVSYAYYNLGMFYFNTVKDYSAALVVLQKGTEQHDADVNDWRMLAHSYERVQDHDSAVKAWQHIKKTWPDAAAVDVNLRRELALQKAAHAASGQPIL